MRIFPKSITEVIWNSHLRNYSYTLHGHEDKLVEIIPDLFEIGSTKNTYLCPLCLKNYFIKTDNGIQGNSEFSLDHLPPESIGGKFKIITCKACNNDSGVFEAELERVINFAVDKNDPSALFLPKIKVKDPQTGNYIYGTARHKDKRTDILFNENAKKYNPNYITFLQNRVSNKEIELAVPLYDKDKIEKALLKSAYLVCFIWWGYEFAFSDNAILIREVLNGKKNYPVNVPFSWKNGEKGISLLSIENNRLAFMVGIELIGISNKTVVNVLIPNPTNQGWKAIEQLNKILIDNPSTQVRCTTLPRIPHSMAYTISWNIILPLEETQ